MTTVTSTPTPEDLVSCVEPIVRRHAATAEAERRLAPEVATALTDAGLFRVWVPRTYGGLELEPLPALRLFEDLARVDAATGWNAGIAAVAALINQALPDEGSAEVHADPRAITAGAFNPPGAAIPVEGGYRVTGQWPFASGCQYATWLSGLCLVMDGDAPRFGPDGRPVLVAVFFRAEEGEILDTWHTLGMRGTGSNDIRATDVFVPGHRSFVMGPWEHPGRAYTGPLYRMGFWLVPCKIAAVALGIARAALDDLLALAAAKTPSYTQTGLADRPVVQDRVARARALIDAGRASVHTAVNDAWMFVQSGARLTAVEGLPVALAASFAMEAAVQAVDHVHAIAGTSAIRDACRFQQYFRDVHTISQHAQASSARFESLGKLLLGRESDWAFYYV